MVLVDWTVESTKELRLGECTGEAPGRSGGSGWLVDQGLAELVFRCLQDPAWRLSRKTRAVRRHSYI